jgi:hypothetical protein
MRHVIRHFNPLCVILLSRVAGSSFDTNLMHPTSLHQSGQIPRGGALRHVEQLSVVRVAQLFAFIDHQPQGLNLSLVQPQGAQVGHAFFWDQIQDAVAVLQGYVCEP